MLTEKKNICVKNSFAQRKNNSFSLHRLNPIIHYMFMLIRLHLNKKIKKKRVVTKLPSLIAGLIGLIIQFVKVLVQLVLAANEEFT